VKGGYDEKKKKEFSPMANLEKSSR
jgi:hypothetical protein